MPLTRGDDYDCKMSFKTEVIKSQDGDKLQMRAEDEKFMSWLVQ